MVLLVNKHPPSHCHLQRSSLRRLGSLHRFQLSKGLSSLVISSADILAPLCLQVKDVQECTFIY